VRGSELISEFLKHSPFVGHLGMELREIEDDRCLLALPFAEEVVTVDFLAAARAQELLAEATVLRRGSSLCFCEVKVHGGDDGKLVATGLVTYKLG